MVVVGAADVAVGAGAVLGDGIGDRPAALEQMFDEPRRTGAGGQSPDAGGLELLRRVASGQPEDAEAGPHALLDVVPPGEQALDVGVGTLERVEPKSLRYLRVFFLFMYNGICR